MSDERQASEHADELVYTLDAYAREREVSPETRSYQEWSAAFEAVRDYIATLEADRARLDWMEAHPHGCAVRHPGKGLTPVLWIVPDYAKGAHNHRGPTLRDAIDSAMSSSPLAPTQEGA